MILIYLLLVIINFINSISINSNKNIHKINTNCIHIHTIYFNDDNLMNKIFNEYIIKNTIHLNYINNIKVNKLIDYLDNYQDKVAVKLFYYRYDINNLQIIRNYKLLSELTLYNDEIIQLKLNELLFYLKNKLELDIDLQNLSKYTV